MKSSRSFSKNRRSSRCGERGDGRRLLGPEGDVEVRLAPEHGGGGSERRGRAGAHVDEAGRAGGGGPERAGGAAVGGERGVDVARRVVAGRPAVAVRVLLGHLSPSDQSKKSASPSERYFRRRLGRDQVHAQARPVRHVDEAVLHRHAVEAFGDVVPERLEAGRVLEGDEVVGHASRRPGSARRGRRCRWPCRAARWRCRGGRRTRRST